MSDSWGSPAWPSTQPQTAPSGPTQSAEELDDLLLGTVAGILRELGDRQGYAVLADSTLRTDPTNSDLGWDYYDAFLFVPRHLIATMTDARKETIRQALNDSAEMEHVGYDLIVRPLVERASPGWRDELASSLDGGKPMNQAKVGRATPVALEDGLGFRSAAEVTVYRALKRFAATLPVTDSVGIVPLCAFRTSAGNIWEPDFLVTYRGRVGAIEVDGPTHTVTHVADVDRDRIMRQSGIGHTDRFGAAHTDDPVELDGLVREFVRQLYRVK